MKNPYRVKDDDCRELWSLSRGRCYHCHYNLFLAHFGRHGETHHIVKPGRSDLPTNFLRLCAFCHRLAEGHQIRVEGVVLANLTLANCLWLKKEHDPHEYDPVALCSLFGQTLPEPEPPSTQSFPPATLRL